MTQRDSACTVALPARPMRAADYFTLNAYWFALSFLWNSMGPILLPTMVPLLVPESQKGSALGLLSACGLILAVIVQPLAGGWSDSHTTGWGRRRPYLVGGTLGDVVFLLLMATAGNYFILLVGYLLLQTSSNIAHGPYQGYIPDLVPLSKRGAVTGVKQFLEIVGIVTTSLAVGNMVASGQVTAAFVAIIAFLLLTMAITALTVTEIPFDGVVQPESAPAGPQATAATGTPRTWWPGDWSSLLSSLFCSRDFSLWLISRLFILLGGNLVRNYALYFLTDVLRLANPAAEVGNLMAIIAVAIAIVVYPAGALSDHWGRKPLVLLSGAFGAAGALLLVTATSLQMVLVDGGIIGVSIGIFLSVNWAWGADLIPSGAGGRFLGISNIATAGSGVVAGLGGLILDHFNTQSAGMGYPILFCSAAICYILGTLVALGVRDVRGSRPA
jgi:Na+/melibiose symporter-like transporter